MTKLTKEAEQIMTERFGKDNAGIAEKLKKAFAEWIDNGHNNFDDINTCILCI